MIYIIHREQLTIQNTDRDTDTGISLCAIEYSDLHIVIIDFMLG